MDSPDYQREVIRKISERTTGKTEQPDHIKNLLTIVSNPANDATLRDRASKELARWRNAE